MKEGTVLEQTRRWSLWAALGSASVGLVTGLLLIWGAVDFVKVEQPSIDDLFGDIVGGDLDGLLGELGGLEGLEGFEELEGDLDITLGEQLEDLRLDDDYMEFESGMGFGPLAGAGFMPEVTITFWGKLLLSMSAILGAAGAILLSLLVASHVRKDA